MFPFHFTEPTYCIQTNVVLLVILPAMVTLESSSKVQSVKNNFADFKMRIHSELGRPRFEYCDEPTH